MTNDHVAGAGYQVRVKFDDTTRAEAILMCSDPARDVAILRVNPSFLVGREVLQLANPSDTMVTEGEHVLAIGSPLNQDKLMTTGVVSRVEATALITDVNLNHGNSGGPLINLDGQAIAINTFIDPGGNGPGISGSILISEALPMLRAAKVSLAPQTLPSPRRLPVAPTRPFPVDSLRAAAAAQKFDRSPYFISELIRTGKYVVVAETPVLAAWRDFKLRLQLAEQSRARETRGGHAASVESDPTRDMRDWLRYEGYYKPVVTFEFTPKVGETGDSVLENLVGRGLAGPSYRGTHEIEYKTDFGDVRLFQDSLEIEDVGKFRSMQPLVLSSSTWSGNYVALDQARVGVFQCAQDWFAPHDGKWPNIRVEITSVEKPERPTTFNLPEISVRRIWEDFASWRAASPTGRDETAR